jgi:hypothetical protein
MKLMSNLVETSVEIGLSRIKIFFEVDVGLKDHFQASSKLVDYSSLFPWIIR